jgi:hypothetical protein
VAEYGEWVELDLTVDDRQWAGRVAAEFRARRGHYRDMLATRAQTAGQADFYGHLAEAGIRRRLGFGLPEPDETFFARRNDGGDDLDGFAGGVQIKCWPVGNVVTWYLWEGGRLVVPVRPWGFRPSTVRCTYVKSSSRLFLDGYATRAMLEAAPRWRPRTARPTKPCVELPFVALRQADKWLAVTDAEIMAGRVNGLRLPSAAELTAAARGAELAADDRSRSYGIYDRRPKWD